MEIAILRGSFCGYLCVHPKQKWQHHATKLNPSAYSSTTSRTVSEQLLRLQSYDNYL